MMRSGNASGRCARRTLRPGLEGPAYEFVAHRGSGGTTVRPGRLMHWETVNERHWTRIKDVRSRVSKQQIDPKVCAISGGSLHPLVFIRVLWRPFAV